jgi:diamine N-acetyltransferase
MIVGEKLRLRAIEAADLPLMVSWRNDPQVYRHFFEYEPLSLEMQKRWFEGFLSRADEKLWIAEETETSEPIGTIGLGRIDWPSRKAELGRVLVFPSDRRGKGYGRAVCRLAIGYAFGHLNLHRLWLEVFANNEPAVGLYRSLGFQEEGRLRQHAYARDAYHDVLLFALLRDEYRTDPGDA